MIILRSVFMYTSYFALLGHIGIFRSFGRAYFCFVYHCFGLLLVGHLFETERKDHELGIVLLSTNKIGSMYLYSSGPTSRHKLGSCEN